MGTVVSQFTTDRTALTLTVDNAFIVTPLRKMQHTSHQDVERFAREHARKHASGVGFLVWILQDTPLPEDEERKWIDGTIGRLGPSLRALVHIVEGTGFRVSAVRGVLLGMNMLTRRPYPSTITADLRSGLEWMRTKVPADGARVAIEDVVRECTAAREAGR